MNHYRRLERLEATSTVRQFSTVAEVVRHCYAVHPGSPSNWPAMLATADTLTMDDETRINVRRFFDERIGCEAVNGAL